MWLPLPIVSLCLFLSTLEASCPVYEEQICSAHGTCNIYSQCECAEGFHGFDCSLRDCPQGHSWTHGFTGDDQAHALAECSDMGICDYATGRCECREGFEGSACERLSCPEGCELKGQCMNLKHLAQINYWTEEADQPTYENMWDANQIYGCYCGVDWFSWDCSQPVCPTGDDPITVDQENEVQLLYCFATTGTFKLRFGEYVTRAIDAYSLTAKKLEYELEKLDSITDVSISLSTGKKVCTTDDDVVTIIEFTQEFGPDYRMQHDFGIENLPPLRVEDSTLDGTVQIKWGGVNFIGYSSVQSEKENELCSNRGTCNFIDGTCECYYYPLPRFRSSDGNGNPGVRGDCGSMDPIDDAEMSDCPGEIMCQGHGECDDDYRCLCEAGWTGGDCVYRVCPEGPSWFDFARLDDEAHTTWTACSSRGACDVNNGVCECDEIFHGAACEYMSCADDCSGRGQCLTVRSLAEKITEGEFTYGTILNNPTTWDADRIYGCLCDEGYTGYNCERRTCPYGDDPNTYGQVKEKQLLECCADGGTFQLSWQSSFYTTETTPPIQWNATAEEVEVALETCSNIDDVEVRFSSTQGLACTAGPIGSQIVSFTELPSPAYVGKSFDLKFNLSSGPTVENGLSILIIGGSERFEVSSSEIIFANENDVYRSVNVTPSSAGTYALTYVLKGHEMHRFKYNCGYGAGNITVNTTVYDEYEIEPPQMPKFIMSSGHSFDIEIGTLPPHGTNVTVLVEAVSGGGGLSFSPNSITWDSNKPYKQSFDAIATRAGTYNVTFSIIQQSPSLSYSLASTYRRVTVTSDVAKHHIVPPLYPSIPIHDTSPELKMRLSTVTPSGLNVKPWAQGLTFSPSTIVFSPGEQVATFKVITGELYGTILINYTVSGNDTANFHQPDDSYITIQDINVMLVTFLTENGDLRSLQPNHEETLKDTAFGIGKLNVFTDGETTRTKVSVKGTTEFIECSGRGKCNYDDGICECETGYRSSNGNGGPGAKGECGYRINM
mmetsp:Transcript_16200/g.21465  ORF Transcript_16200/g.21465 Transcript_16200/m.21465 type:complete len:1005 (-) Transcript_16200:194-3208(-)